MSFHEDTKILSAERMRIDVELCGQLLIMWRREQYLGDALYATMVYAILRLLRRSASVVLPAMVVMAGIELFQLTMIPAHMLGSEHLMLRICAHLIGTEFSFLDLLAYAVGIGCVYLADPTSSQA